MKKVIPIISMILGLCALVLSLFGLSFAILSELPLMSAFAIVFIVIGFAISAISCGFSFIFFKSKLCVAAAIISSVSLVICIAAFVVLV